MNESLSTLLTLRTQALQYWRKRAPRERIGLLAAGSAMLVLLVWILAVQPAWRTLRDAPAQLDRLEVELQRTQRMAAEARELRNAAPVSNAAAGMALQSATGRLGSSAKLNLQGDRATLTLTGTPPEALRAWLAEVRSAARARPVEAQLARAAGGYSGNLTLSLGSAP